MKRPPAGGLGCGQMPGNRLAHRPQAERVFARDLDVRGQPLDGYLRLAPRARVKDLEVLLAGDFQALQRLAEAGAEKPEARGVQAVMLADDVVALKIDQLLV